MKDLSCPQCNYDQHLCPGCGDSVPHGQIACGQAPCVSAEPYPERIELYCSSPMFEHAGMRFVKVGDSWVPEDVGGDR